MEEEKKTKKEIEKDENKEILENLKKEKEELLKVQEETKKLMELRDRQFQEQQVSGQTEAGTQRPKETEEEKITRESNEFLKSTGLKIE